MTYARNVLVTIPWAHWMVMGMLSIAVYILTREKSSGHSAFMAGLTAFVVVLLLDTAVFLRLFDILPHGFGYSFKVDFVRLLYGTVYSRTESLSNIVAFIPFGFFLSEFLASTKSFSAGRRLGLVTLAGFGLSLTIESLQLLLHVGFFELTDLVMNTVGAFVGAGASVGVRSLWNRTRKS